MAAASGTGRSILQAQSGLFASSARPSPTRRGGRPPRTPPTAQASSRSPTRSFDTARSRATPPTSAPAASSEDASSEDFRGLRTLPGGAARMAIETTSPRRLDEPRAFTGQQEAGATGLEPATSGVTGRRSNQLSYAPEGERSVCQARRDDAYALPSTFARSQSLTKTSRGSRRSRRRRKASIRGYSGTIWA